jgi:hypothetical protein
VLANQDQCKEFAAGFLAYSDLWTQDMATTLDAWLHAHTMTNEGAPSLVWLPS